jgi:hypothetical protein
MIEPRYLRMLALSLVVWLGLFLIFTWTIDPYGVSPTRFSLPGVNALKPKRIDIDRLVKPYEVWRYQPRTVFLGTSRIHQSINPAILDGSRFAPAYNAAIPGAAMDMNAERLRQYLRLDRNLHTVIVELFLPNIVAGPINPAADSWFEFIGNAVTLFASASTLWDSVATLAYNALSGRAISQIEPSGYLYHPNRGDPQTSFESFASYIWSTQVHEPDRASFNQSAFDSVRAIIEIARANNLELIFLVAPSHSYADYYYDFIGAWDTFEEWLVKVSQRATVYSFSQPNDWVDEPISAHMVYWYDTFHFSLVMGRGMLASLAGLPASGIPGNFMERMTPENVTPHIELRRQAARRWAEANPAFVTRFGDARRRWLETARKSNPN